MTIRALLGALSLSPLVAMPAAAHAAAGLETQQFKVSVKGVQTTAWSSNWPGGGLCHPSVEGEGTEVVRFASTKPQRIEATRMSPKYVAFGGLDAGDLVAQAKVTRHGKTVEGPLGLGCVDPDGGGEVRPPDCGTKRTTLHLTLSYESFGKRPGLTLRKHFIPMPDPFRDCEVVGVHFPEVLDRNTKHKSITSHWPMEEVMDGSVGKTIVIGRGRKVTEDATSTTETTIRWEVTLRRIGPS